MSVLPENAKYRPHLAAGAPPGAAIIRQRIIERDRQFVAHFADVAKRHGWTVREVAA
jgi:hypothetical protein